MSADVRRPSRVAFLVTTISILGVSGLVMAWTWGAAPWKWGFFPSYFGLALVLRVAERWPALNVGPKVQVGVLTLTLPFALTWFFGFNWPDAALHLGAVAVGAVTCGALAGGLPRRDPLPSAAR